VKRTSGAVRIFLYNWPVYVGTWVPALLLLGVAPWVWPGWAWLAVLAGGSALAWSVASLLVSYYVYDRSALVSGSWIPALLTPEPPRWATIHAGLDAEIDLDAVMKGSCVARLETSSTRG
jgi:hypothetical protein